MEKENYLDNKTYTLDVLNYFYENSKTPFISGTSRLFEYDLLKASDLEIFLSFIATALFQIEKDGLEERVREQVTYWIYQYKKGVFKNLIEDEELLKKDIKKIETMITLRFEDLECYKTDK